MPKKLIIAEKPSVAKDIAAALGGFTDHDDYLESDKYIVAWALGHLVTLFEPGDYKPEWKAWLLSELPILPDGDFQLKAISGHKSRLAALKKLAKRKDVEGLINACDAGREGELIFWRIVAFNKVSEMPTQRLWMQSMTHGAIIKAFDDLRDSSEYTTLRQAAQARSYADFMIGINGTRALTRRLKGRKEKGAYSVGRVQTPTLTLLVNREKKVLAHVPEQYCEVTATFEKDGATWIGSYYDKDFTAKKTGNEAARPTRLFDATTAAAIVKAVDNSDDAIASETRKRSKQKAPLLFDLTALQRDANSRHGLSAKRTLQAAQRLYERHKLLTYPRTDSKYLPDDYRDKIDEILAGLSVDAEYGPIADGVAEKPLNLEIILNTSKVSDHFAIIPTGSQPVEQLSGDDVKVFDIVVRRFLAAMMPPAGWVKVERLVEVTVDGQPAMFRTTAKGLEVPGFMAALGKEAAEPALPPLLAGEMSCSGQAVMVGDAVLEEKETKPVARFSEGALLGIMENAGKEMDDDELRDAMEGHGIGTPATRADTIERLVHHAYARRLRGGKLIATAKGLRFVDILERIGIDFLTSPLLTGELELALKNVQAGKRLFDDVRGDYTRIVEDLVGLVKGFDYDGLYENEGPIGACPSGSCDGSVFENLRGYSCQHNTAKDSPCDFMIWKELWGRYVDRKTARQLVGSLDNAIGPVASFVDKAGKSFSTMLTLTLDPETTRYMVLIDVIKGESDDNEDEERTIGTFGVCPLHDDCRIIETNHRYICDKLLTKEIKKGGPLLMKVICHREISIEEAKAFFGEAGRTEVLDGFVSRRGNGFRASLFRKETGRVGFEFPPRPVKEGAAKKKAPAKKKTTAKKKAPAKKKTTVKKKAPAKKKTTAKKKAPAKKKTTAKKKAPAKKKTTAKKKAPAST